MVEEWLSRRVDGSAGRLVIGDFMLIGELWILGLRSRDVGRRSFVVGGGSSMAARLGDWGGGWVGGWLLGSCLGEWAR